MCPPQTLSTKSSTAPTTTTPCSNRHQSMRSGSQSSLSLQDLPQRPWPTWFFPERNQPCARTELFPTVLYHSKRRSASSNAMRVKSIARWYIVTTCSHHIWQVISNPSPLTHHMMFDISAVLIHCRGEGEIRCIRGVANENWQTQRSRASR